MALHLITGADEQRKRTFVRGLLSTDTFYETEFYEDYDLSSISAMPLLSDTKVVWIRGIPQAKAESVIEIAEGYSEDSITVVLDFVEYEGDGVEEYGALPPKVKREMIKKVFEPKKGPVQFDGTRGEKRKLIELLIRNTPELSEPLGIELKKLTFLFKSVTFDQMKALYSENEFLLTAIYEFLMDSNLKNRKRLFVLYDSQGDAFKFMMIREIEEISKSLLFGLDTINSTFKKMWYKKMNLEASSVKGMAQLMIQKRPFDQVLWDLRNKLKVG